MVYIFRLLTCICYKKPKVFYELFPVQVVSVLFFCGFIPTEDPHHICREAVKLSSVQC